MKLSQLSFSPAQHIVVFGDPKTGKTELLGSLATKYKLLWFDIENGVITLTKLPAEVQDNIEVIQLPDSRVYPIAATTMLHVIKGLPTDICVAHGTISCPVCTKLGSPKAAPEGIWHPTVELNKLSPDEWIVVLDGITQLGNSILAHICRSQPDDYKPGWEEFRLQGSLLDRFFSQVQQAKFNFICTALAVMSEGEDKSQKLSPACGTVPYSRIVSKYFDHVLYCEMKGKKHAFGSRTTYSLTAITGSRTDVAIEDQRVDHPTMLPFFEGARAAKDATSGVNQAAATLGSVANQLNKLTQQPSQPSQPTGKGGLPTSLTSK